MVSINAVQKARFQLKKIVTKYFNNISKKLAFLLRCGCEVPKR